MEIFLPNIMEVQTVNQDMPNREWLLTRNTLRLAFSFQQVRVGKKGVANSTSSEDYVLTSRLSANRNRANFWFNLSEFIKKTSVPTRLPFGHNMSIDNRFKIRKWYLSSGLI